MTPQEQVTALAQSIYLAKNGRYNDVDGDELTAFLIQSVDWINQFLEELEYEAEWNYLRTNNNVIGTIVAGQQSYDLPDGVRTVVTSPYRDATIQFDGAVVETFAVVNPNQISNPSDPDTRNRATVINQKLILSREPNGNEVGGELRADTIAFMPKIVMTGETVTTADALSLVRPQQLIILGVAKNATLPDIVQGGISPSLTQKYNDLLQKAVAINNVTSESLDMPSENFGWVRGVW